MLSAREFEASSEPSSDDDEVDISYRSPMPSSTGFPQNMQNGSHSQSQMTSSHKKTPHGGGSARGRGHRHTASIASLIRGEERGPEDGWSPVAASFAFGPGGMGRTRTD